MGNQENRGDCTRINLIQSLDDIGNDQFEQFINGDGVQEFCTVRDLQIPRDRYEAKELIDNLEYEDILELVILYDN